MHGLRSGGLNTDLCMIRVQLRGSVPAVLHPMEASVAS